MSSVCVGDAFGVDGDGKLILKLDGNPAGKVNPNPGTCNPLRVDPSGGLWAPPEHKTFWDASTPETLAGTPVGISGTDNLLTHSFDVTNPSNCRDMRFMVGCTVDAEITVTPGSKATIFGEYDDGQGSFETPNQLWMDRPLIGSALGVSFESAHETTMLRSARADPGETLTLRLRVSASESGSGTVQVNAANARIRVWGWTM